MKRTGIDEFALEVKVSAEDEVNNGQNPPGLGINRRPPGKLEDAASRS